MANFYEVKNQTKDSADIYIYGTISRYAWFDDSEDIPSNSSMRTVSGQLKNIAENTNHINLYINSPGGDASEGIAIANWLSRQPFDIDVYIDALCASIATVIAFGCGGKVHIYDNATCMIHNAWGDPGPSNSEELRALADRLDVYNKSILSTYMRKANGSISEKDIEAMMDAETWLSADDCIRYGFADDKITSTATVAACLPYEYREKYKNIPKNLLESAVNNEEKPSEPEPEKVPEMPEEVKSLINLARATIQEVSL